MDERFHELQQCYYWIFNKQHSFSGGGCTNHFAYEVKNFTTNVLEWWKEKQKLNLKKCKAIKIYFYSNNRGSAFCFTDEKFKMEESEKFLEQVINSKMYEFVRLHYGKSFQLLNFIVEIYM